MDSLTFPEDFKVKTVSEFCAETKSGSTPSRINNEYWENGTISWVKSGEVHNNITLQTEEYITPLGLTESSTKLLPKDTVLMAMYGVTAGEVSCNRGNYQSSNLRYDMSLKSRSSILVLLAYSKSSEDKQTF